MKDGNPKPAARRWRVWLKRGLTVVVLCAAAVIGWMAYVAFESGGSDLEQTAESFGPSEKMTPDQLILGTWQDDYQGKRTMRLKSDGTGTMLVELEGWNATLFAKRMNFEMAWSIKGDRLTKRTIGGEPEGRVKAVLAMMGDEVEEEILELTDERLLVKEVESGKQFDWRRVPE